MHPPAYGFTFSFVTIYSLSSRILLVFIGYILCQRCKDSISDGAWGCDGEKLGLKEIANWLTGYLKLLLLVCCYPIAVLPLQLSPSFRI